MATTDQILASIEARIQQLQEEAALLESARSALAGIAGGDAKPAPARRRGRSTRRSAAGRPRGSRVRRRPAEVSVVEVGTDVAEPEAAREPDVRPGVEPAGEVEPAAGREAVEPAMEPRRERRPRVVAASEPIEALLREFEGLSSVAIAKRLRTDERGVRQRLRELEEAGQVRSEGSRRTSLWRLVTDEERVAERAGQLEAQRRTP
jgi:hypothetical protein